MSRQTGSKSIARRWCDGTGSCRQPAGRAAGRTITPRYKFSHVLYLEVPYRLLPAMRRAQIHRRIGQRGEAIYGDRVGEIAAELAMHFEQGHDHPRAVKYLLQAAENATHRSAHHEAAALARRGLQVLDASPETS